MAEPSGPESTNPWEKWEPKKTDIELAEVVRLIKTYVPVYIQQSLSGEKPEGWSSKDIRAEIEKEHDASDFAITAQVAVAKGTEPVIGFTFVGGADPLDVIFGIHDIDLIWRENKFYADIEVPDKEGVKVQARAVYLHSVKPPSANHIIISEGLKEKLGIQNGEKIRIADVYQDISSLNLDEEL